MTSTSDNATQMLSQVADSIMAVYIAKSSNAFQGTTVPMPKLLLADIAPKISQEHQIHRKSYSMPSFSHPLTCPFE